MLLFVNFVRVFSLNSSSIEEDEESILFVLLSLLRDDEIMKIKVGRRNDAFFLAL